MLVKILIFFIIPSLFGLPIQQKKTVRAMYVKAVEEKKAGTDLIEWLAKQPQTPYVVGYTGATKMILAKHFLNPINKLRSFNAGKRQLSSAIKRDEQNLELVFLRYATQSETPSFLGYKDNIATDKAFILRNLKSVEGDEELVKLVTKYMQTRELSAAEKQQLKISQK